MKQNWTIPVVILIVIFLLACAVCVCLVFGSAYYQMVKNGLLNGKSSPPTSTPVVIRPIRTSTATPPIIVQPLQTQNAKITPTVTPLTPTNTVSDSLQILNQVIVPSNNLVDLAHRLEGKKDIILTQAPPAVPLQVGEQRSFWVSNNDTNENFQVEATLQYITAHSYFWVQNDVTYNAKYLQELADTFENKIYPTDREFFGSEWTPGVDGDPHIYILYARGLGGTVAGMFSTIDEYPPAIHKYSNWHEMFLFNADYFNEDNVSLRNKFTYGVLAHEFQHMIHWYRDRNEDTWLNEGFADLAILLNGYDVGGHDIAYVNDPDVQLNDWPTDHNATIPHYGAAFLFMTYFLDRFGEDATKFLVTLPENGLESIDLLLQEKGIRDPLTGKIISADDIFQDWVLASYIQDGKVSDGRYTYSNYPSAPQPSYTESISSCNPDMLTRDVHQYAVDYIRIECKGNPTLHFEGSMQVGVVPPNPYSGSYAFWSNKGDESDMTLTRPFDFTSYTGELTLSYETWYDIEKDFDYVYLEASTDGENWQILNTPSGTADDPNGNSYGWGYTGISGTSSEDNRNARWLKESVDISQYAGKKVQLRFEYVTDTAVNGEGFLLDNISIPQVNYFTDFENDPGGWESSGFVRIQNELPQTFRLALITYGSTTTVTYIPVSTDNTAEILLSFGGDINEAVVVVSGTTRFTRLPAAYRFYFTP